MIVNIMKTILFLFVIILQSFNLNAQTIYTENTLRLDTLSNMPTGNINDVAWLTGHWVAEAFGGLVEDVWLEPLGGSMLGVFRSYSGGEIGFYELFTISELQQSLILRLKHFSPDLKGWEKKDNTLDFKLVKISKDMVWFEGFTIQRIGANKYNIYLATKNEEGTLGEMVFKYTKRERN